MGKRKNKNKTKEMTQENKHKLNTIVCLNGKRKQTRK